MNLTEYINTVDKRYRSGISSEHSYRADLEHLIRHIVPNVEITNEPSKVTDCGNPDYVITRRQIPVGFIEAKDIGKNLDDKRYQEQFERYRKAIDNLIITDYLVFRLYSQGDLQHEVRIGDIGSKGIQPRPQDFELFESIISEFCTFVGQTIRSPKKLAEMMAGKARLLESILEQAVCSDEDSEADSALKEQYETFRSILIHDLSPKDFADIYAQTLSYGMFAARLHDKTLDTFSRQEAAELIPKSNPFLRKLFAHVAGPDIDDRIRRTVENLAEVFRATNVKDLLKGFGKGTESQDPMIHFYETFLASYDPALRKSRGVWYTPAPVVEFIVRSVNYILKTRFGLAEGIADTTYTNIRIKTDKPDRRTKSGYVELDKEVHKVQVLDPATGTGTFLAEIIRFVFDEKFRNIQGAWENYVNEHLVPRINGFEILMASYAMAHLKLDLLLAETGFEKEPTQRFNVFLTNSLEEYHPDTGTLFSSWLSKEANEANRIKRDTPVMVVMGNPPYSGHSSNQGEYAKQLVERYKKGIPELSRPAQAKWLSDDYVKFISYSQELIERTGEGIIALITNHSYLSNPTFRGMRKSLLNTFDEILVVDLHGNSKIKETPPQGVKKDENVFDIQQGVSILLAIRSAGKKGLGSVCRFDVWGTREEKYNFLRQEKMEDIEFEPIDVRKPQYLFEHKDWDLAEEYEKGFKLSEIARDKKSWGPGMISTHDQFAVSFDKAESISKVEEFLETRSEEEARNRWRLCSQSQWLYANAKTELPRKNWQAEQATLAYRPFDVRSTIYDQNVFVHRRERVSQHFREIENIGLCFCRQLVSDEFQHVFVTDQITDDCYLSNKSRERGYILPLYLDTTSASQGQILGDKRQYNLSDEFLTKFSHSLGLGFSEFGEVDDTFSPLDAFDYIYAVLHSPDYRLRFGSLLRKDFPRVPFPTDPSKFKKLTQLGRELRCLHLLKPSTNSSCDVGYPIGGSNEVTRPIGRTDWQQSEVDLSIGKLWINDDQYFEKIPTRAYEMRIGAYQPAIKWLKDRKGRALSYGDIVHYQRVIGALDGTSRIMNEIQKIGF